MNGRDITKVFCPRRHRVGTVRADADGLLIAYSAEVWQHQRLVWCPGRRPAPR
jgi:hypothetical protein